MQTYSLNEICKIIDRKKPTVSYHLRKMPESMVIRENGKVRVTEAGLLWLQQKTGAFEKGGRLEGFGPDIDPIEYEAIIKEIERSSNDFEQDSNDIEQSSNDFERSSNGIEQDSNKTPSDPQNPSNDIEHPSNDDQTASNNFERISNANRTDSNDMPQIIDNLTSERDSLRTENDALKARIEHLEETIRDLRDDRDRWVSMAQNAQRLHDQEQRIHVQDIALLSKRKLLPSAGGNIFDRIKNVFKREQTEGDSE